MLSNRVALAVVGSACVLAAGAGGFLASRYAGGPDPVTTTAASAPAGGTAAPAAVDETEAIVQDAAATGSPAQEVSAAVKPAEEAATEAPRRARATAADSAKQSAAPARVRREAERRQAPQPDAKPASEPAPESVTPKIPEPVLRAEPTPPPAAELPRTDPVELARAPERQFDELVVPPDSVIGLQLERSISSETARVEDRVEARVTRDVRVNGRVAIPAGSHAQGSVTLVERGGKVKERSRLGVRFHTLVLADGTNLPLQTETVYREGDSPAASSSAKIGGGAIGGAIIGAIIGGSKGAIIGGTTGAAGGTAAVMAGGRRAATMPSGSTVTVRVLSAIPITVER